MDYRGGKGACNPKPHRAGMKRPGLLPLTPLPPPCGVTRARRHWTDDGTDTRPDAHARRAKNDFRKTVAPQPRTAHRGENASDFSPPAIFFFPPSPHPRSTNGSRVAHERKPCCPRTEAVFPRTGAVLPTNGSRVPKVSQGLPGRWDFRRFSVSDVSETVRDHRQGQGRIFKRGATRAPLLCLSTR